MYDMAVYLWDLEPKGMDSNVHFGSPLSAELFTCRIRIKSPVGNGLCWNEVSSITRCVVPMELLAVPRTLSLRPLVAAFGVTSAYFTSEAARGSTNVLVLQYDVGYL